MKILFIEKFIHYDGQQLSCQYAYLEHRLLGNSIIAWRGSCNVDSEYMADGEDLLAGETISSDEMIHFLVEIFDTKLVTAVALQRLLATIVRDEIYKLSLYKPLEIRREGDDLFLGDRKLSISVAAQSPLSCLIHFAVNITNEGTPVKTGSLTDLSVDPVVFAKNVLSEFQKEYKSILEATYKVLPVV